MAPPVNDMAWQMAKQIEELQLTILKLELDKKLQQKEEMLKPKVEEKKSPSSDPPVAAAAAGEDKHTQNLNFILDLYPQIKKS